MALFKLEVVVAGVEGCCQQIGGVLSFADQLIDRDSCGEEEGNGKIEAKVISGSSI